MPNANLPIAHARFNFTQQTVNLQSSAHIKAVSCSRNPGNSEATVMTVIFSDRAAYLTAKDTWPINGEFIVIGFFAGCGLHGEGERTFSKVHKVDTNDIDTTVKLLVRNVPLQEVVKEGEIKWGNFKSGDLPKPLMGNGTQTMKPYYGVGVGEKCLGGEVNVFDVELDKALGKMDGRFTQCS